MISLLTVVTNITEFTSFNNFHTSHFFSYTQQLLAFSLPEVILVCIITYILLMIAVQLGDNQDKSELALDSLHAFKTGLSFIILLYVFDLFFGTATTTFNGYLVSNVYVTMLKLLTTFSGFFILKNSELYIKIHPRDLLEYPTILVLAVLFILLLVGANHLISAFLALVGFSLNLYILILFDAPTAIAREAGIKYFYLSAFSSGLILYGIFLLFLVLGTGHLSEMSFVLTARADSLVQASQLLQFGVLFFINGFIF